MIWWFRRVSDGWKTQWLETVYFYLCVHRFLISHVSSCRCSVFAVAMYPTISDRVLRTRDRQCEFVPAENPNFVVALALLGHHIPCLIITISYVIVYLEIRKLIRTRPQDKFKAASAAAVAAAPSRAGPSVAPTNEASTVIAVKPRDNETVNDELQSREIDDTSIDMDAARASSNPRGTAATTTRPPPAGRSNAATASTTATSNGGGSSNHDRERKTFVTLSYIVIAYVLCWVPFHFIYDVSFIKPEIVPQQLFVALFWMTYVNSLLNPFLYAFSSADVRTAVRKMILCQFKKTVLGICYLRRSARTHTHLCFCFHTFQLTKAIGGWLRRADGVGL